MAYPQFRIWKNSLTNVHYHVPDTGGPKWAVDGDELAVDLYFLSLVGLDSVIVANTSQLRAWLNGIPNA